MSTRLFTIRLFILMGLLSSHLLANENPQILDQRERVKEICNNSAASVRTPTGAHLVNELSGLTNYYREKALNCLLPKQSFVIPLSDQKRIVGENSTPDYKQKMICILSDMLPLNNSADEISSYLDGMEEYKRLQSIKCIKEKIARNLSSTNLIEILGPIMPKEDSIASLKGYNDSYHITGLCHLGTLLKEELTSSDASRLLGLTRNYQRLKALKCINDKLSTEMKWEDVDLIVGPSISSRGSIVDSLNTKMPDGLNTQVLLDLHSEFKSNRFLVDPDPPSWLNGQCVEWARYLFNLVSEKPLTILFERARNIPERAAKVGFVIENKPTHARVGALIVWDDGGAGHVGVVTKVSRDSDSGSIKRISVSEANWGTATENSSKIWGLDLEQAGEQYVTSEYGKYKISDFYTNQLDRPPPGAKEPLSYKFLAYVLPISGTNQHSVSNHDQLNDKESQVSQNNSTESTSIKSQNILAGKITERYNTYLKNPEQPPEYLYRTESAQDNISTAWMMLTDNVRSRGKTKEIYDQFYSASLDYMNMRDSSLISAHIATQTGDYALADRHYSDYLRFDSLYISSALAGTDTYNGDLQSAYTLAEGIYKGSKAAAIYGSKMVLGPTAVTVVEKLFTATDFYINQSEDGTASAVKQLVSSQIVSTLLNKVPIKSLGGKTITNAIENSTTTFIGQSQLYSMLNEAIDSEEAKESIMKFIANSSAIAASEGAEYAAAEYLKLAQHLKRQLDSS